MSDISPDPLPLQDYFCIITQKDDLAGYNMLGLQLCPQNMLLIASLLFSI